MNGQSTVLVTGGAGYIGSHACKALDRAGYVPVTLDNLSEGYPENVQWGPLEEGDILDRECLARVVRKHRPIAVMHFAANAYVRESVREPGKYYENNVCGSLNLLRACQEFNISHFVFSSTCATYGNAEVLPMTEDHPQNPITPYGHSKKLVEQMLRDFDVACGLKSISLRYFNAAGADEAGEIGEAHDPETHLVPLLLDTALGRREQFTVFGSDYDTPDGTCIRDFVHVTDLANAHVLALQALLEGSGTTAYNLGNGSGYSVKEIIREAGIVTGKNIRVQYSEREPGDPARLVADATRVSSELGWQPVHSRLTNILQTAWAWHQKRY